MRSEKKSFKKKKVQILEERSRAGTLKITGPVFDTKFNLGLATFKLHSSVTDAAGKAVDAVETGAATKPVDGKLSWADCDDLSLYDLRRESTLALILVELTDDGLVPIVKATVDFADLHEQ